MSSYTATLRTRGTSLDYFPQTHFWTRIGSQTWRGRYECSQNSRFAQSRPFSVPRTCSPRSPFPVKRAFSHLVHPFRLVSMPLPRRSLSTKKLLISLRVRSRRFGRSPATTQSSNHEGIRSHLCSRAFRGGRNDDEECACSHPTRA